MTYEFLQVREFDLPAIRVPRDALEILQKYADSPQETFLSISLDGAYKPIACHIVSIGTVNRSLVHPRDVFRQAIQDNAAAILIAHNHPSGKTTPSDEDIKTTKALKDAGDVIGIQVLDHIIFSRESNFFSFRTNDMI